MDIRTLRRRCEARLRDILIPLPFAIDTFAEQIARQRGRPIEIHAFPLDGLLTGVWVATRSLDIIFFDERASPSHQVHIILHEMGHILCDHRGIDESALATMLPVSSPHRVAERLRALRPDQYDDTDEREAEMLASLIMTRVREAQANGASDDPQIAGTLRLLDDLEGLRP